MVAPRSARGHHYLGRALRTGNPHVPTAERTRRHAPRSHPHCRRRPRYRPFARNTTHPNYQQKRRTPTFSTLRKYPAGTTYPQQGPDHRADPTQASQAAASPPIRIPIPRRQHRLTRTRTHHARCLLPQLLEHTLSDRLRLRSLLTHRLKHPVTIGEERHMRPRHPARGVVDVFGPATDEREPPTITKHRYPFREESIHSFREKTGKMYSLFHISSSAHSW